MSTTASTSKVPHTLVGTRVKKEKGPFPFFLSVLLIRRGGKQFIQQRLEELCSESVDEIILIDHPDTGLDLEQLISTYPRLRVLLLDPQLTLGHQINLGIEEAQGKWVCLQWTDMSWGPMPAGSKFWQDVHLSHDLVFLPELRSREGNLLPSRYFPLIKGKELEFFPVSHDEESTDSCLIFDHVGLYNREQFLSLTGFDPHNPSPYWQGVDFSFRAHLWGFRFHQSRNFRISYLSELAPSNTSRNLGYRRFFLRNLSLRYQGDSCVLPLGSLWTYFLRAKVPFSQAWSEFKEAKQWVNNHRFRFKNDGKGLCELWGEG